MKKKYLIITILLLGIGFASIITNFYVTGTASVANADFNVIFTAASLDGNDITSTAISNNGTTITYSTSDLKKTTDLSILNFTVKNNSSMYDANVSITCSAPGTNASYYTITPTINGATSATIEAKYTKDGQIKVKPNTSPLNAISEEFTCTINATAIEKNLAGAEPSENFQPIYFAFGLPTTTSNSTAPAGKSVFIGMDASGHKGVCTIKEENPVCFQINYPTYEKQHISEVADEYFHICTSPGNCTKTYQIGNAECDIKDDGSVSCSDSGQTCSIDNNGNVSCS